jgi:hypothetical protein|tara:strand:+ start:64 stop:231 length:168 start_codon:yes stop_codon:yes gene_type:complete
MELTKIHPNAHPNAQRIEVIRLMLGRHFSTDKKFDKYMEKVDVGLSFSVILHLIA